MTGLLLTGLLITPLLLAIVTPWFARPEGKRNAAPGAVMLATAAVVATLCALALIPLDDQEVHLPAWLPGTGAMSLHAGGTGLLAALVTSASAAVLLFVVPRPDHETQQPTFGIGAARVLLIALTAANAAFLAGHFLGRYVALEIVALCIALMHLIERRRDDDADSNRTSHGNRITTASWVYLILRLGDAGLLAAILILMTTGGTLVIEPALASAANLDGAHLAWVAGGFALAVWVKTGTWPFQGWLRTGRRLSAPTYGWLYLIVAPNLGLYLLYRVTPVVRLSPVLSTSLLILGMVSTGVSAARLIWALRLRRTGDASADRIVEDTASLLGGLGLALAPAVGATAVKILLLAGTPLRLVLAVLVPAILAPSLPQPDAPARSRKPSLAGIARLVRQGVEVSILERSVTWVAGATTQAARTLHRTIEQEGLEGLLRTTARATITASHWLQRRHTGQLRRNVAWIAAALVVLLVVMVGVRW